MMTENGKTKIVGDDIMIVKQDLYLLKEVIGRMSESLDKTCSKVQFLGVADELVELKKVVTAIGTSVSELKQFVERAMYPNSPPSIVNKGISRNRGGSWGTSVRLNGYDYIGDKMFPDFSSPKGSSNSGGIGSSGKESKYGMRNKGSKSGSISRGPFIVECSLIPLDLQLLNYAFEPNLDRTEIVVELEFNDVIRGIFCSFKPGIYINGEILSCVCEILTVVSKHEGNGVPEYSFVTPRFSDVVFARENEWMEFVTDHYVKKRYMCNLLNCKKAFFPMLDKEAEHWFLVMVDLCSKKIEIWDSFQSSEREDARISMCMTLLESLDVLFDTSNIGSGSLKNSKFCDFQTIYRTDAPYQTNGYDCGMFVIAFMQDRCSKTQESFEFNSDQRRCDLAMNLLKTKLNRRWDTLEFLADKHEHSKCKNAWTTERRSQSCSQAKRNKK